MDDEREEPAVTAVLRGTAAVVHGKSVQDALHSRGYGEEDDNRYILRPFESLYLLYKKSLVLKKAGKPVGFDYMLRACMSEDSNAFTDYLIYRDLRVRGYTVRAGFGFGSDFLVYERGDYGQKGAKYSVFGFSEGSFNVAESQIPQVFQLFSVLDFSCTIGIVIQMVGECTGYHLLRRTL